MGGVTSLIVKLVVQVEKLPTPSVVVMVTVCGPTPVTVLPATGLCVTVGVLQLSVATVLETKSGIVAWQLVFPLADWGGAQVVIVGGVVSPEVTVRTNGPGVLNVVLHIATRTMYGVPPMRSVAVPKDQFPVQPWSQQSLPTWLLSAGVGHAVWIEMIVSTSVSVVLHVLNVHGQLLAGVK
ncbi:MAG: hypothetical protein E6G39_13040 [Actinobacteria bacterium]|nr:MAG: hypothetical protein E6G39_13040 [Actinomycetota bacterium]